MHVQVLYNMYICLLCVAVCYVVVCKIYNSITYVFFCCVLFLGVVYCSVVVVLHVSCAFVVCCVVGCVLCAVCCVLCAVLCCWLCRCMLCISYFPSPLSGDGVPHELPTVSVSIGD